LIKLVGLLVAASWAKALPAVNDGDLIFQKSRSNQSVAIQKATHSPYSHMGLIMIRGGKPFVLEASANVKYTPLKEWTERGEGGRFVLKRLKDADSRLTKKELTRLREVARGFEGRPYDLTFEWSDDRIYCSELVWKIYKRALDVEIGELQKLGTFDLADPAVKAKMRERYGARVPLDETVISPAAMFDSPLLRSVAER
jgi:hypothetical protein